MDRNAQKLQALLYSNGGEMKKAEIASLMELSKEEVEVAIENLKSNTQGIEIIETLEHVSLRTSAEYSEFITQTQKKNSEKDVGTAGLEVLSIVLYKNGASRSEIDYIRGVNSSATLRQLILRGLLERSKSESDSRAWEYKVTPELLSHVGVSKVHELPEYETMKESLQKNYDD
ncbi:hypothetical protein COB52_01830 [Candidatus Kaiserbacteria bacterium]|nr:MAG: hypothetical protein COB52_01830 [Candidatus Kaiserbacteria bacterium]